MKRMAEREGFEPPIPLRVCLISSQKTDPLHGDARRCRLPGMICDINDLASDELGTPLHRDAQKWFHPLSTSKYCPGKRKFCVTFPLTDACPKAS